MPRRALVSALALSATVAILAGCGGSGGGSNGTTGNGTNNSSSAPATELTSAIDALGNASTVDATLKIHASASQVLAFVKQQDPTTRMTASQANTLAGAQVAFEFAAPSGKTLSQASGSNSGTSNITVSDNGTSLFTLRVVNQTLFFQVDLKDLLDRIGKSSTYAQIQAASAQLPAFIQALLQGKWVSLSESTAKSLSSALGGSQSSSSGGSQSSAVLNALKSLLTKDVTVTRTSTGSTDVLTVSGNTRTLAGDFTNALSSVPAAGAALGAANLSSVPSRTLKLTASVTGGALSGITIDAAQFSKNGKGSLPIQLSLAQSGPAITAPAGATPIDANELEQLLGSFAGAGL